MGLKLTVMAVTMTLVASACGGGSDTGNNAVVSAPDATFEQATPAASADELVEEGPLAFADLDETSRAAADALTTAYGDEAAFVAVAFGLERGYDANQVIDAALSSNLGADGRITIDGEDVVPSGAPVGRLVLPDDGVGGQGFARAGAVEDPRIVAQSGNRIEGLTLRDAMISVAAVAEVGDELNSPGKMLVALITGLAAAGYSLDQIVDALVLNSATLTHRSIGKIGPGDCSNQTSCVLVVDECIGLSVPPSGPGIGTPCAELVHERCKQFTDSEGDKTPCVDLYDQTEKEQAETGQNAGLAEAEDPAADEVSSDIGPLEWTGEGVWTSEIVTQFGPATMTITRTPDTDDFSINAVTSTTSDHVFTTDGFDEVPCTSVTTRTYEGTGTFRDEFPWFVLFVGVETTDQEWVDCAIAPAEPLDGTLDRELQVTITETGIEGGYVHAVYTFPGVPIPIADVAT